MKVSINADTITQIINAKTISSGILKDLSPEDIVSVQKELISRMESELDQIAKKIKISNDSIKSFSKSLKKYSKNTPKTEESKIALIQSFAGIFGDSSTFVQNFIKLMQLTFY